MATITRENAIVGNRVLLESRFYLDSSLLTDVHEILRVEIWKGYPDLSSSKLMETIFTSTGITWEGIYTSTGIIRVSTGIVQYWVSPLSEAATYYDRVHFIPEEGAEEEVIINRFDVSLLDGVSSIGIPTCRLYGTITDSSGEPVQGVEVKINKADFPQETSGGLVVFRPKRTWTNSLGKFNIYVQNNVKFVISVPSIGYRRIFLIPAGVRSKDIRELDSWLYPPADNPGELNDFLGTSGGVLRPSSTGYTSDFQNEQNMPVFSWTH